MQVKLAISDGQDLEISINLTESEAQLIDVFLTVLKDAGSIQTLYDYLVIVF